MTKVTTFGEEDARDDAWTVATAKARLSEVIDRARTHGPQLITRNGRPAAVVVGADEWERKTRRVGSLAEFFASSPLRERVDLQVERSADRPRAVTKFLLDTNAVSEWAKPSPDVGLAQWLATTDEDGIYLSVITLAELRDGIERLQEGRRRVRLDECAMHDLSARQIVSSQFVRRIETNCSAARR